MAGEISFSEVVKMSARESHVLNVQILEIINDLLQDLDR